MFARRKSLSRKFFATLLLLVYGSTGVLGYGLHSLWHLGHDHGGQLADCEPGHCHDHGHSRVSVTSCCGSSLGSHKLARFSASDEDCSICDFLAQAQTPDFEFTLAQVISKLGSEIVFSEDISPLFIPADHLARGPPLC